MSRNNRAEIKDGGDNYYFVNDARDHLLILVFGGHETGSSLGSPKLYGLVRTESAQYSLSSKLVAATPAGQGAVASPSKRADHRDGCRNAGFVALVRAAIGW
jgi:hypothetical protein